MYRFFAVYPSHGTRQETHLPVVVEKLKLLFWGKKKAKRKMAKRKWEGKFTVERYLRNFELSRKGFIIKLLLYRGGDI